MSEQAYYKVPDRVEGKWYDSTPKQWMWLSTWMIIGSLVLFRTHTLFGKLIGLAVIVVVGFLGAWRYSDGPGYQIASDKLASRSIRKRGGSIALPKDAKTSAKPPINLGLMGVKLGLEEGPFPTGTIVDYERGYLTFYVTGEGWEAVNYDPDARMSIEAQFTDALIEVCATADVSRESLAISYFLGARPWNMFPTLEGLSGITHPDFHSAPGEFRCEADERAANNHQERLELFNNLSADTISGVALTMRIPKAWRKYAAKPKKHQLTAEDLEDSIINRVANSLVQALRRCEIANVKLLDLLELDEFVQIQWNLAGAAQLHQDLHWRRQMLETGLITPQQVIEQLSQKQPWPSGSLKVGRNFIEMDGTLHSVSRIVRHNRRKYRPGGMQRLQFIKGPWFMYCVCGDAKPASRDMKYMTKSIVLSRGLRRANDSQGRYYTLADREEQARSKAQQDELHNSGGPSMNFNKLIVISATSEGQLKTFNTQVKSVTRLLRLGVRPIKGETRQIRAFASALLGVNIL